MFGSKKQTVLVEGMMCQHCAAHVKEALEKLDGVADAKVDLKGKCVEVKVKGEVAEEAYRKAIEDAGYKFVGVR
ncbi:MAG: heavy-metal-associated domain-containing protein [Bacilli bacterium]|nr:heavy-metal-associated domain-containing protein [Bacilli bacterium]